LKRTGNTSFFFIPDSRLDNFSNSVCGAFHKYGTVHTIGAPFSAVITTVDVALKIHSNGGKLSVIFQLAMHRTKAAHRNK